MYKKRLIDLRNEYNLKQLELAKILSLAPTTYNNYENEYETMPIKHLNNICNYFNISLDYLFNFTDLKTYTQINEDIDNDKSGQRLKDFRLKQKLTQKDLARLLNVDQTTISKYETGLKVIATNYLYTICKKYNISADYLLGKTDN